MGKMFASKAGWQKNITKNKKEMKILHCELDEVLIDSFIAKLLSKNLLEDSAIFPDALSHKESERYNRQILQFSVIDKDNKPPFVYQERLKNSTVAILGMGGWGTWCALQLTLLGIGNIKIVDGDDVELTNINRQVLYSDKDIGQQKVHAAKSRLEEINAHVNIMAFNEFVTRDETRLKELLHDIDLIILAWASLGYYRKNTVEEKVHSLASLYGIPIIELGGDPIDISVGPVFPYDGKHCSYNALKQQQISHYYSSDNEMSNIQQARMKQSYLNGERVVNAWQSAPSLAAMSGLVSDQVIKIFTRYDDSCLIGKRFHISLRDFSSYIEDVFKYG